MNRCIYTNHTGLIEKKENKKKENRPEIKQNRDMQFNILDEEYFTRMYNRGGGL